MQEECLWMTNFGQNCRDLKASIILRFKNKQSHKQDDWCDPVINIYNEQHLTLSSFWVINTSLSPYFLSRKDYEV